MHFNDTEWQDISEYDKKSYYSQWENWNRLCLMGFVGPTPQFMNRNQTAEDPVKLPKKKVISKDDNDWLPAAEDRVSNLASQKNCIACGKCQTKFYSHRILKKHEATCVVLEQGITGRHLKRMSDSDLQEMGINKGARMDISDVVEGFNEHEFNAEVHLNQSTDSRANGNRDDIDQNLARTEVNSTPSTPIRRDTPNVTNSTTPPNENRAMESETDTPSSAQLGIVPQGPSSSVEGSSRLQSGYPTPVESLRPFFQTPTLRTYSGFRFGSPILSASTSRTNNTLRVFSSTSDNQQVSTSSNQRNIHFGSLRSANGTPSSSIDPSLAGSSSRNSAIPNQSCFGSSRSAIGTPSPSIDPSLAGTSPRDSAIPTQSCFGSSRSAIGTPSSSIDPSLGGSSSSSTGTSGGLNSEERVNKLLQEAADNLKIGYNINEILPKYRGGDNVLKSLQKDGFVAGPARKVLSNILINHINLHPVQSVSSVSMREEMAVSFVVAYPKMAKKLLKSSDKPWHHWFNINSNTGFLQNVNASCQRLNKKLTGTGQRRSKKTPREPRKLVDLPSNNTDCDMDDPDPADFLRNVNELKNLMPNSGEKANILHLMAQTFERRRHHLEFKELETTKLFQQYPHFLSYQGEVLEQEFGQLFPGKSSLFLRAFSIDFVPKLMKIAKDNPTKYEGCDYFGDELLNALIVLGKLLPTPRRSYSHEARQPLHPHVSDIFHMIPLGSDPSVEAGIRRASVKYPVQPHIMAIGAPRAIGKMFLVCGNSEMLELPRNASPTNAIDLLCKTYFAVNLHYPLGWKNVLRFLQVHLYEIPLENARESSFDDALVQIRNTPF